MTRTSSNAVSASRSSVGERERFLDGARAVPGHEAGVPERIPELFGHRADGVGAAPAAEVVHEQDVDVGARAQLAARVRTEGHERDVARRVDAGERLDQRGVDRVGERLAERAPAQREVGDRARRAHRASAAEISSGVRARARQSRLPRFGCGSGPRPGRIHTFPSPILPVRAASTIFSATRWRVVVLDEDLELHLRHEVDGVLGAAVHLGVTALATEALHLGHRQALCTPNSWTAVFTSSTLNGLTIATTSFTVAPSADG